MLFEKLLDVCKEHLISINGFIVINLLLKSLDEKCRINLKL